MHDYAKDGGCLAELIQLAIPICQQAQARCPRTGPGRKPEIPDWVMTVLIVVSVLKHRKSKSAQYRYLSTYRREISAALNIQRWPGRSTYFDRYRRAWKLYEVAVQLMGERAITNNLTKARCVAVDQSMVCARGRKWNRRSPLPKAADRDGTWAYSTHHQWVFGYSFEVVVTAEKEGPVWPLLASVDPASAHPCRTFADKIALLPAATRYVLADAAYDSNEIADAVECQSGTRCKSRRMLCPYPDHRSGTTTGKHNETRKRRKRRLKRRERYEFFQREFAQRMFRRRGRSVEPFNEWLKTRFDLHDHVWHYGLDNNKTQILAAIFAYQLLLLFNFMQGNPTGQIQWILDTL